MSIIYNKTLNFNNKEYCLKLIKFFKNKHIIPYYQNIDIVRISNNLDNYNGYNIYFQTDDDKTNDKCDDMLLSIYFENYHDEIVGYRLFVHLKINLNGRKSLYTEEQISNLKNKLSQFFNISFYPFTSYFNH